MRDKKFDFWYSILMELACFFYFRQNLTDKKTSKTPHQNITSHILINPHGLFQVAVLNHTEKYYFGLHLYLGWLLLFFFIAE